MKSDNDISILLPYRRVMIPPVVYYNLLIEVSGIKGKVPYDPDDLNKYPNFEFPEEVTNIGANYRRIIKRKMYGEDGIVKEEPQEREEPQEKDEAKHSIEEPKISIEEAKISIEELKEKERFDAEFPPLVSRPLLGDLDIYDNTYALRRKQRIPDMKGKGRGSNDRRRGRYDKGRDDRGRDNRGSRTYDKKKSIHS
jgi:hypothetical protein